MANTLNVQLSNTETIITQGGATPRNILCIRVVNTDTAIRTFSLYQYPTGGVGDDTTVIKRNYQIIPDNDYVMEKDELIRLGNLETLFVHHLIQEERDEN